MATEEILNYGKNEKTFICHTCDFKCLYLSDWNRHISTRKHKLSNDGNKMDTISGNEFVIYECGCGKNFKTNSGLWKHKKKCTYTYTEDNNGDDEEMMIDGINIKDKDALVFYLLKQNAELIKGQQDMMVKLSENNTNNNNYQVNNNNNNNNKTFNLQFFLNETCKDAMNISDFVSNIKLELNDLEYTGRTNYIEGISNIVIKNLNSLEKQLRPLHCSDYKREVLYIKDNDQWIKETDNKPILTNAIKKIANENIKQINKWVQQYPDCTKADSKKNDLYLKIVSNSMNGLTQEEGDKNINKIISNVAKKVTIDK
jgi:hypothetical protein